ncbi:uncharacterized protein BP5553_03139 [Venustampulla echinocandica]|uniref:P-loop containing nucleoside triphosphate hydrolase n=1 Tax=Venustampulla echinocandica TaxID=2656787 RepID=A0A370TTD9_9HELO|nr:uncharacterized protein BP5553_03139 [Venustampulla echinocandica]RDL38799.1 hypothetical protein BP5553_03139 [Venustampulla echinocandica]
MLPQKRQFLEINSDNGSETSSYVRSNSAGLARSEGSEPPSLRPSIQKLEIMLLDCSLPISEIEQEAMRAYDNLYYHFNLEHHDGDTFVACSQGNLIASCNALLGEAFNQISHEVRLDFDLYVTRQSWAKAVTSQRKMKDGILYANINVLGDISLCKTVGNLLSAYRLYLQRPLHLSPGQIYQNPHHVTFPGLEPRVLDQEGEEGNRTHFEKGEEIDPIEKDKNAMKTEFAVVFGSLVRSQCLGEHAANRRIKADLLPHQKEALDFITQRESGPIPSRFSLWKETPDTYDGKTCYEHVITENKTYDKPVETGGGILADDMGLGKTLTMIATIVATLNDSTAFQSAFLTSTPAEVNDEASIYRARATLVLVPSQMLLKSWAEEISKHIYGGLKVCEYHGRGRESNLETIANCEVVLSTYHTLVIESSKPASPLFKLNWFRVILDEAHTIRTSSTLLFDSVRRIEAKFRWCVTGTPVQNGLEDLGSLVAFLRVSMLDTRVEFKQHIIDPLTRKFGAGSSNLRVLLDSICLRRINKLLDLPGVDEIWHDVKLSDDERRQYDAAEQHMSNEIKRQVNLERSKRGYFGILELEMRLRRMCNHGTFEQPRSEYGDLAINKNPEEADCTNCDFCKIDLEDEMLVGNLCNGHYTACGHLICSKCLTHFEQALATAKSAAERMCPLCGSELTADYLVDRAEALVGRKLLQSTASFRREGVSSKINALLANIEKTSSQDKSIIFSGWTLTLDLIERHLKDRVQFQRIDGTTSLPMRNKILNDFRKNSKIRILMMTTGTGAVGLNLAVASCVHIFEPQWNPMVEAQAVARVIRLGQKKQVSIIRYIVKGTVEQTMRSQQQRKLALANLGWSKAT